jgi:predicted transcriptional regulator of viral defense system
MKLSEQIREYIENIPTGKTFGYADLGISQEKYVTAAKALERLQKKGVIKKVAKGKFYKPQKTVFGELKPDYYEQLRPYLYENGKRMAYVTGVSLYNQMRLTTQVPSQIKIASYNKRIYIKQGVLKADAVKAYARVTSSNYKLLGILDALKDIKKIPDSKVSSSVQLLGSLIAALNKIKIKDLIKYALLYPPRVRALLGAIIDNLDNNIETEELKNSLNPLSKYKIGLKDKDLPTIKNWNIE